MAETSVDGAIRLKSSGDRPTRTNESPPPPPPPPPSSSPDLISALPEAVIHHIFSFLPLKDFVKASVLSKLWLSTWTTTNRLVFNGFSDDLPSLVDGVLTRCTSPVVKTFLITYLQYDEACLPKLDLCLRFAEGRRVEHLRLHFRSQPRRVLYKLPRFLYCLSWLVRLEVSNCCFSLGSAVTWPCLKVLLLGVSELSDDILGEIVRGSPVLESVELCRCRGVRNIVIDSTSVVELKLSDLMVPFLETIWAPHLLKLRLSGTFGPMLRLEGVSSLEEVDLLGFDVCDESDDLLKELLEKLRGVATITISESFLQMLSSFEMEGVPSPLSKCQNLILYTSFIEWKLPNIAHMLRSLQRLEKLVIHFAGYGGLTTDKLDEECIKHFDIDEDLLSRMGNLQCLAKHLKRVEITRFADKFGSKHLLTLIKFLLGDALVLEKMIIKAYYAQREPRLVGDADISTILGVSRNVLNYRRASQNAEVIFDYPLEEVSFKKQMKWIQVSEPG